MRHGYLHVCVILDESASMAALRDDVLYSLKEFFKERRVAMSRQVKVDFYLFAEKIKGVSSNVDLNDFDVEFLEASYECRGATAFNDSFCEAVDSLGADFARLPESERPERVVVAVVTDGVDNCSAKATLDDVYRRLEEQSSVYNWSFEFFYAQPYQLREGCFDDESAFGVVAEPAVEEEPIAKSVATPFDVDYSERVDASNDVNDERLESVVNDEKEESEYAPTPYVKDVDERVDSIVEAVPSETVDAPLDVGRVERVDDEELAPATSQIIGSQTTNVSSEPSDDEETAALVGEDPQERDASSSNLVNEYLGNEPEESVLDKDERFEDSQNEVSSKTVSSFDDSQAIEKTPFSETESERHALEYNQDAPCPANDYASELDKTNKDKDERYDALQNVIFPEIAAEETTETKDAEDEETLESQDVESPVVMEEETAAPETEYLQTAEEKTVEPQIDKPSEEESEVEEALTEETSSESDADETQLLEEETVEPQDFGPQTDEQAEEESEVEEAEEPSSEPDADETQLLEEETVEPQDFESLTVEQTEKEPEVEETEEPSSEPDAGETQPLEEEETVEPQDLEPPTVEQAEEEPEVEETEEPSSEPDADETQLLEEETVEPQDFEPQTDEQAEKEPEVEEALTEEPSSEPDAGETQPLEEETVEPQDLEPQTVEQAEEEPEVEETEEPSSEPDAGETQPLEEETVEPQDLEPQTVEQAEEEPEVEEAEEPSSEPDAGETQLLEEETVEPQDLEPQTVEQAKTEPEVEETQAKEAPSEPDVDESQTEEKGTNESEIGESGATEEETPKSQSVESVAEKETPKPTPTKEETSTRNSHPTYSILDYGVTHPPKRFDAAKAPVEPTQDAVNQPPKSARRHPLYSFGPAFESKVNVVKPDGIVKDIPDSKTNLDVVSEKEDEEKPVQINPSRASFSIVQKTPLVFNESQRVRSDASPERVGLSVESEENEPAKDERKIVDFGSKRRDAGAKLVPPERPAPRAETTMRPNPTPQPQPTAQPDPPPQVKQTSESGPSPTPEAQSQPSAISKSLVLPDEARGSRPTVDREEDRRFTENFAASFNKTLDETIHEKPSFHEKTYLPDVDDGANRKERKTNSSSANDSDAADVDNGEKKRGFFSRIFGKK